MRFEWKSANFLSCFMWGVGVLVALAIPDQPRSYAALDTLISLVGAVMPSVDRLSTRSIIPEIAQAYWAIMWVLVLVWQPFYFRLTDEQVKSLESARRSLVAYRLFPLIVLLFFLELIFVVFLGEGRVGKAMLNSRLGLGLLGGAGFSAVGLSVRAMVTWWRYQPKLDVHVNSDPKENSDA